MGEHVCFMLSGCAISHNGAWFAHFAVGLQQHINYFIYMGVDGIILSRILESPFTDFGRDVSNFKAIDPVYGTMEELKHIIHELHENSKAAAGRHIVLFNDNHRITL